MAVPFYLPDDVDQMETASGSAAASNEVNATTGTAAASPNASSSAAVNMPPPNAMSASAMGSNVGHHYHHHHLPHYYHQHQPATPATASSTSTSSANSTPSTSFVQTQTPLQSPVNGEYLVQAFCEALNRYSRGGVSPGYPMTPSSPTCSPHQAYGEVFFPQANIQYGTPSTPRTAADYNNQRMPPRSCRMAPSRMNFRINSVRYRLNSAGEAEEDGYDLSSDFDSDDHWDDHFNYITAREQLQEFPGRVPSRKKKAVYHHSSSSSSSSGSSSSATGTVVGQATGSASSSKNKSKSKYVEPTFAGWPTVFTAVVIALGCGILVSR